MVDEGARRGIGRGPRGEQLEDIDFDRAVQLLADKRAKGPAKPKAKATTRKPAAKKATARKSSPRQTKD
mgnify:CR=1 FL=1